MNRSAIDFLLSRRSAATPLAEPGPTPEQLELILQAATTVPDHGQLKPYRFVVVQGEARARFGDALAAAGAENNPALTAPMADKLRGKAFAAPALVAIVSSPKPGKIPEWEQAVSASCTGFAIALAADAIGLAASWKSAGAMDGSLLREALRMAPGERLLGWVLLGQHARPLPEGRRAPVDLAGLVTTLEP